MLPKALSRELLLQISVFKEALFGSFFSELQIEM